VSSDAGITWKDIPGANSPTYQRNSTSAGNFLYRLTVTEQSSANIVSCRIASKYVAINVHPKPIVNAGADRVIFSGESVTLQGIVTGENPSFNWDPPDHLNATNILDPVASPPLDKEYSLYATSSFGCKNEDAVFIKVVEGIFVPNSPGEAGGGGVGFVETFVSIRS